MTKIFFIILGFICSFLTLKPFLSLTSSLSASDLKIYLPTLLYFSIFLILTITRPLIILFSSILFFLIYCFLYNVFSQIFLTLAYLILMTLSGNILSNYYEKKYLKTSLANDLTLSFLNKIIFLFLSIFTNVFLLLLVHKFSPNYLLGSSIIWLFIVSILNRKKIIFNNLSYKFSLDSFPLVCSIILVLISGLLFLFPGAMIGDSDKAYLAIPKFYKYANSIFLNNQVVLRDCIRSFPYFQEFYLASGYLLGGNLGAKFLAWIIIPFKLYVLYIVTRSLTGISRSSTLYLLVSISLIPVMVEYSAGERPDNLLSIFIIILFYLFEKLNSAKSEKKSDIAVELFPLIILVSCICISIKYTAFFFFVAFGIVYFSSIIFALKSSLEIMKKHYAVIIFSFSLGLFWYIRNIILFGEITSLSLSGKYHLTIIFPPIRSLSDLVEFIQQGLILTSKYTEYFDFAFGLWGLVIIGLLVTCLGQQGTTKRAALLSILFSLALFFTSRQIRYLSPIVPIAFLAIFSLLSNKTEKILSNKNSSTKDLVSYCFIFFQGVFAITVNWNGLIGHELPKRFSLNNYNFSKVEPYFSEINDRVKYPENILVSAFDANYNIDANLIRVDETNSIKQLISAFTEHKTPYVLLAGAGYNPYSQNFFDDLGFFNSVFRLEVSAGHLNLFSTKKNRLLELKQYVENQGWDLDSTVIISDDYYQKFPYELIVGEEINLPNLKNKLYRLSGIRKKDNQEVFRPSTDSFVYGQVVRKYIEKNLQSNSNLTVEIPSTDDLLNIEVYGKVLTGSNNINNTFRKFILSKTVKPGEKSVSIDISPYKNKDLTDLVVLLRKPDLRKNGLLISKKYLEAEHIINRETLLSIEEDFENGLKVSRNLEYKTVRNNVVVKDLKNFGGSMIPGEESLVGSKSYIINLPDLLIKKNLVAKLFLSGESKDNSEIKIVISQLKNNKVINLREDKLINFLKNDPTLVSEFFSNSSKQYDQIKLDLVLSKKEKSPIISNLVFIVGEVSK